MCNSLIVSVPTLLKWPKTRDWIGHGDRGKPAAIILLKEHRNKMIFNDILLVDQCLS